MKQLFRRDHVHRAILRSEILDWADATIASPSFTGLGVEDNRIYRNRGSAWHGFKIAIVGESLGIFAKREKLRVRKSR